MRTPALRTIAVALLMSAGVGYGQLDTAWITTDSTISPAGAVVTPGGRVYVTGGYSNSVKAYGPNGETLWSQTYPIGLYGSCEAFAIAADSQENVLLTGSCMTQMNPHPYPPFEECSTVKISRSGARRWSVQFPEQEFSQVGNDIAVDGDGNSYVVMNGVRFGVVKYDTGGSQLWERDVGVNLVRLDHAGNVYGLGTGGPNYGIAKYRPDGTLVDTFYYREHGGGTNWGRDIAVDHARNVYVTGFCDTSAWGDYDLVTVKFGSSGNLLWVGRVPTGVNSRGTTAKVAVDVLGNAVVAGNVYDSASGWYVVAAKYGAAGGLLWKKTYSGTLTDLALDAAGNAYVLLSSGRSCVLVCYGSAGSQAWVCNYDEPRGPYTRCAPFALRLDSCGDIYVIGESSAPYMFIIKYRQKSEMSIPPKHWFVGPSRPSSDIASRPKSAGQIAVGPSVFQRSTTIRCTPAGMTGGSVRLFDGEGRVVREFALPGGFSGVVKLKWDGTDDHGRALAAGTYFAVLSSGGMSAYARLVKVRPQSR